MIIFEIKILARNQNEISMQIKSNLRLMLKVQQTSKVPHFASNGVQAQNLDPGACLSYMKHHYLVLTYQACNLKNFNNYTPKVSHHSGAAVNSEYHKHGLSHHWGNRQMRNSDITVSSEI